MKDKKNTNGYQWDYCSLGGVVRVNITSGEDIAHLGELDQKLWTVLSCPVKGLEFDSDTLKLLDTDGDGKIRVPEVVAAAEWLTAAVKDKDSILKGESSIALDAINTESEIGKALHESAKQILANLGKEKDCIGIEDTSDSVAIFKDTKFNGDGIITVKSSDDEAEQKLIETIGAKTGTSTDRNGEPGITAENIETFYAALADYAAWQDAAEAGKKEIFPYGDDTEAALAAVDAIKDKVADYFMRCKLIGFDEDVKGAVDVNAEKIGAISDKNLATQAEEIAVHPLARPRKSAELPFEGINPAWQAAFASVKALVLDKDFAGKDGITEDEWNAIVAKFAAFTAWKADKKGDIVEDLGIDAVKAELKADRKAALLGLVEKDVELKEEAEGIDAVNKLTHLYRDFAQFLRNYVIFTDFYAPRKDGGIAVFDAGELYIDQRCCNLCVRVEDMGKHADMAGLSGMFLIYCACTSKTKAETMNIVAVMTAGSIRALRPGKNGVFYDREGGDWDATIIKVVDNPISVRQAFWNPYRKLGNFITDKINKSAAEKEAASTSGLLNSADKVATDKTAVKQPFDIAKYAGIFAAVGLALGALGAALAGIVAVLKGLAWWQFLLIILAIMLIISAPSCFIAWSKLRKRNLGPVLNANGWAVNSNVIVNTVFGKTLTSVAKYPKMNLDDPYAKKTPAWVKWLIGLLLVLAAAFCALFFSGRLADYGLKSPKQKKAEAAAQAKADSIARADSIAAAAALEEVVAEEATVAEEVAE